MAAGTRGGTGTAWEETKMGNEREVFCPGIPLPELTVRKGSSTYRPDSTRNSLHLPWADPPIHFPCTGRRAASGWAVCPPARLPRFMMIKTTGKFDLLVVRKR
ncbi:NADH dehydrogenase [ubiquinone] iron-sulfur protein 6, mitochondrial isoform X3 [Manis pentadactyla]|uniref:NADH dehydrogenase [ubiquinone] iron-sulfur protein 6, mitochondrial isoform X3 n=1 Tax=Manis pentadactyla TaxID=143292 RepID=UPI00255C568A|nr:NADH dehydrogenase [ubiquinone] iron-sulfur protein 6, mitochondrial isoform X3 [Manis pentadactyla]